MSQRQKMQDFPEELFDVDNVVDVVCDIVGVVDGGNGVNPLRNSLRNAHKKFQLSMQTREVTGMLFTLTSAPGRWDTRECRESKT